MNEEMLPLQCEGSISHRPDPEQGLPNSAHRNRPDGSAQFETTDVVVLLLPVWRRVLFEDLATAKHGVSLLCRDDGQR